MKYDKDKLKKADSAGQVQNVASRHCLPVFLRRQNL